MSQEQPLPVADLLGNDGPLPEVRFNGRAYPVGLPCPAVVAAAERAVPALALANLKATQEFADPAEYARDEAALKAAIRGREYGFGRSLFNSVLGGPDGNRLILWACLRLKTPDITLDGVRDMLRDEAAAAELEAALEVVAPAFFRLAAEGMDAPPADRSALAEGLAARVAADLAVTKLRRLALRTTVSN
jgi:hypothetical protein